MTTVNATAAPVISDQNPQDWLSNQKDLIEDGNCGCRMTLAACQERQARHAHKALIGNERKGHEVTRHYFIPCISKAGEDGPCPYYHERERDPKGTHKSWEPGRKFDPERLEKVHKRKRFNRATRGVITARSNE